VEYKEALNCEPANWRYWRGLAGLQEATGAWADARLAYSRAIALSPHESTLLRGRARVLRHLKEWDLAAHDYKTATELNPTDHWLKMELAELYIEAEKLDEAVVCFEQIAKASSNDVMPLLRVATLQLMRGDALGYQTACERLLGRFEQVKSVLTANSATWACALGPDALKDMGRAVRLAEWVVSVQPNNTSYRDTLGALYYRAGDMKATIKELSESKRPAASGNSFRPVLTVVYDRLFLAMALYRSKRVQEAKELLETAIEQLDTMGRNRNGVLPPQAIDPWQRRELSLLRKEAETLIKPKR
jgi:tetratricopeptide (TPR) repeat protein